MKINISTIENEAAISEVQSSAGAKVVGGLDFSQYNVDANSIGITDLSGIEPKNVDNAGAISSAEGIVSQGSLQSESGWSGWITVRR